MPAGIIIRNPGNELVFTSDAFVYHYLGTATLQSTTPSPTTIPVGTYGIFSGRSIYTIDYTGDDIVVATPIPTGINSAVSVVSKTKVGSTWTIVVQKGNGAAPNAAGFLTEESTTVYVWGKPISSPNFGLAIYAPDGSLRADMSKKPLLVGEFLNVPQGSPSANFVGSYTVPGIATFPAGSSTFTTGTPNNYTVSENLARWYLDGTTLRREKFLEHTYFPEDVFVSEGFTPSVQALIIELSGL